jgi:hypothetical protein
MQRLPKDYKKGEEVGGGGHSDAEGRVEDLYDLQFHARYFLVNTNRLTSKHTRTSEKEHNRAVGLSSYELTITCAATAADRPHRSS